MQPLIRRLIGVIGLVFLLAMAGTAVAQDVSVMVEGPEQAVDVMGGATETANVDVTLQAEEFFCAEDTDLMVSINAEGADGVAPTPSEDELAFTVSADMYFTSLEQAPYEETQSVAVDIEAPSGTTQGFSTQLNVEAVFDGANPEACGPNELPGAQDLAPLSVNVQADAEPTDDETDGGEDDGTGGDDGGGEDGNGIPLPAWIVPAAGVSAALVAGRRF